MRLLLNKLSADPELLLRRFCLISFKKVLMRMCCMFELAVTEFGNR
jgi:hypothetical protein